MDFDGWLYRHPHARSWFTRLLPERQVAVSILARRFDVDLRAEIGMLRLATLLRLSPTAHELGAILSLMAFLPRTGSFIDVGANVGLFAVPAATIGDVTGCTVVAIEPHPETAARLRRNLRPYRCATVLEAAASSAEGVVTMGHRSSFASATFRVAQQQRLSGLREVRTLRLDSLTCPKPWTIKIDVEDHEADVIDGLSTSLRDGSIQALMLDSFGPVSVPTLLADLGYALYDGRSLGPFDAATGFNLLAVRRELA